jgi:hypothetical protein
MICKFECFGMVFVAEFYTPTDVRKVWAKSGGWEVEISWDMLFALKENRRREFGAAMDEAIVAELSLYTEGE